MRRSSALGGAVNDVMEQFEYEVMAAVEHRHWWYRGMRALAAAWLDEIYQHRADVRILDAGCGTGGNGAFLQRYGTVAGIDIAPLALQLGRQRLNGSLARASVMDLPFRAAAFDLVTSFDVLYHRAVVDETAALREVVRVLKPDGCFLMRLPAYQWLSSSHDRSVHGARRYTAGQVRSLVEGAGLIVERLSYINSLLLPIPLLQRSLEQVLPRTEQASQLELPHPIVNSALSLALSAEAAWLRSGGRFPAGLSVLALARKSSAEPRNG